MKQQSVWLAVCAGLLGLMACEPGGRAVPPGPTPLVLISIDTLRADRLGCYGYEKRTVSPHIDALAEDGILFENHISAAPWTIPAHISLLTSLWPSNHGVTASLVEIRDNEGAYPVLSESRTTLAEILGAHGYSTAAFTAGDTLDPGFGYGQGFSIYRTNMFKLHEEPMREMGQWVADHGEQPFFVFWHTFESHAPYLGTRFLDEVLPEERAADVREAVERYGKKLRRGEVQPGRFKSILVRRNVFELPVLEALYVGAVADTDRWVGHFLEKLRTLGLYERALIVLTSDHGEEFGDRSPDAFYDAHGHSLWREMVRVLRPLWEAPGSETRTVFIEALEELGEEKAIQAGRYKYLVRIGAESVARRGRVFIPLSPEWQGLYDLEDDPGETVNLLEGPTKAEHERRVSELDRTLREHMAAQRPDSRTETIDPATVERLQRLGYVE